MRKALVVTVVVAVAMLGFVSMAKADSQAAVLPLAVSVTSDFGFTLSDYTPDFTDKEAVIGIYCRSNNGVVWYMAVEAPEFTNTTSEVLPSNPNFTYAAWSDEAAGTWIQDFSQETGGSRVMPTSQEAFYTSTVAEGSDDFIPLTIGMWLVIPAGQAAGLYETDVTLTMYD